MNFFYRGGIFIQDEVKQEEGFRSIDSVLEAYIQKRGWKESFWNVQEEELVFSLYRKMKDPLFQKYSKLARFRGGILYITSTSASAIQEMVLRRQEILEFMNQGLAKKWVREIRFFAGAESELHPRTQLETQHEDEQEERVKDRKKEQVEQRDERKESERY